MHMMSLSLSCSTLLSLSLSLSINLVYFSQDPPGAPRDVQLSVSSAESLTVKFLEPEFSNGAPVTRYKGTGYSRVIVDVILLIVQWSKGEQFTREGGEFILCDTRNKEYVIPGLDNVS